MRTSISVPDDIHEAADDLTHELNVSRGYREERSEVATDVRSAQRRSVVRESWPSLKARVDAGLRLALES